MMQIAVVSAAERDGEFGCRAPPPGTRRAPLSGVLFIAHDGGEPDVRLRDGYVECSAVG
jgi:hypothetical protein